MVITMNALITGIQKSNNVKLSKNINCTVEPSKTLSGNDIMHFLQQTLILYQYYVHN